MGIIEAAELPTQGRGEQCGLDRWVGASNCAVQEGAACSPHATLKPGLKVLLSRAMWPTEQGQMASEQLGVFKGKPSLGPAQQSQEASFCVTTGQQDPWCPLGMSLGSLAYGRSHPYPPACEPASQDPGLLTVPGFRLRLAIQGAQQLVVSDLLY